MTDSYEDLWAEINRCDVCINDERIESEIRDRWKKGAFLPLPGNGPEPSGLPVVYLLVAQEPSASWTQGSIEVARKKIADGFRNFNVTGGDFAIRWAAHNWLVNTGEEAFLLTDLAKCPVAGEDVSDTMPRRYRNCRRFLNREVEMFLPTLRAIVPVGKEPYRWCIAAAEPEWPTIAETDPEPQQSAEGKAEPDEQTEPSVATEAEARPEPKSDQGITKPDTRSLEIQKRLIGKWNAIDGSGWVVQFDEDWSVPLDAIAVSGGLLMKNPKRYEIDTSGELPVLKIVGIKTSLVNAQYRIKSLSSNRMELSQIGGTAITPTPWEPTLVRLDTGNSQADSTPAEDTKAQPKPEPEFRKWTDTTGQFSVEAKFVGLKDGKVQLKKGNGTVLRIRAEIT